MINLDAPKSALVSTSRLLLVRTSACKKTGLNYTSENVLTQNVGGHRVRSMASKQKIQDALNTEGANENLLWWSGGYWMMVSET